MNLLFLALTVGVIGKVLLATGVLMAHSQIVHEHKIDRKVLKTFRIEHTITIIGITLIVLGYFMEVYFYEFTPFFSCLGSECSAMINAALSQ